MFRLQERPIRKSSTNEANYKCQNPNECQISKWDSKRVQNDILVMPNQVLNLIQDLRISASRLSFRFDLTFELCHLAFAIT
jgi:hypothetical protein